MNHFSNNKENYLDDDQHYLYELIKAWKNENRYVNWHIDSNNYLTHIYFYLIQYENGKEIIKDSDTHVHIQWQYNKQYYTISYKCKENHPYIGEYLDITLPQQKYLYNFYSFLSECYKGKQFNGGNKTRKNQKYKTLKNKYKNKCKNKTLKHKCKNKFKNKCKNKCKNK